MEACVSDSEVELLNTFWTNYNSCRSSRSSNEESIWLELFLFQLQQCQHSSIIDFEMNFLPGSIAQLLSNIFICRNLANPDDFGAKKNRVQILETLEKIGFSEIDEIFAISIVRRFKTMFGMPGMGLSDTEYLLKFPILCPSVTLLNLSSEFCQDRATKSSIPNGNTVKPIGDSHAKIQSFDEYLTKDFKKFSYVAIDDKMEFLAVLKMLQDILMINWLDPSDNCLFTAECLNVVVEGVTSNINPDINSELIWIDILSMILQKIYSNANSSLSFSMKNLVKCLINKHSIGVGDSSILVYYSYNLFTILNNTFFMENSRECCKKEFDELFLEIEPKKELFLEIYKNITENNPEMSARIINLWIEIYVNFKEFEIQQIKGLQKKELSKNLTQNHHLQKVQSYQKFICYLECLLIHILPFCMERFREKILSTLKNIGICCCNCARWSIKIFLNLCFEDKIIDNVLIFSRKIISILYKNPNCRLCFEKISSHFADDDFVKLNEHFEISSQKTDTIANSQEIRENKVVTVIAKNDTMLGKFNKFFLNGILGFVYYTNDKNTEKNDLNEYESRIFAGNTIQILSQDSKRRIWSIFGAVLGTLFTSHCKNDFDFKMFPALLELKKLIIQHSVESVCAESAKAIVRALETILIVGESQSQNTWSIETSFSTETLQKSEESCDNDFQTPTQSLNFNLCGMDMEKSDEDYTSFTTAEDGEYRETDTQICDQRNEYFTLNKSISKTILEILFEISELCLKHPAIWEDYLIVLFTRLRNVRHLDQLTTFIIKGFCKLLQCNDNRLIYLQNSVLDLITKLDTAEALAAYFKLFTAMDPPIELLLAKLSQLATTKTDITVLVEVNFPTIEDVLPETDLIFLDSMQLLKKRSSILAPLDSIPFTPWKVQGFTVSLWINLKDLPKDVKRPRDSKTSFLSKILPNTTHIFSIGTKKLVLSIHLDNKDINLLHIQLIKPKKCQNDDEFLRIKEPSNHVSKIRSSCPAGMQSMLNLTKSALRSNWNLGSLINKDEQRDTSASIQTSIKVKLPVGKWTFLAFSVTSSDLGIFIETTVDCKDKYSAMILCEEVPKAIRNSNLSVVAIGDSQFQHQRIKYSLSNLMLFKESHLKIPTLVSLMGLGPNCNNLISGQIGNSAPNFGFIKPTSLRNIQINPNEAIRVLKENLVLSFSAENPEIVMEYLTNCNFGSPMVTTKNLSKSDKVNSFYSAVLQTGGLSSLLFLFARVVELSDSSRIQAESLKILLNVAHSNVELYTEFIKGDYLNTIGSVLRNSKCSKNLHILKSFMDIAFDKSVVEENVDGSFDVKPESCYLIYPELVVFIINNYRDWHTEPGEILEFTLKIIKSLTTTSTKDYNIKQMMSVEILPNLINFCKIFFVGANPSINITTTSAKLIVDILAGFGPSPPSTSFIDEIAKLLLLLHQPSYTYVTQDRANYYYLLSKTTPSPPKFNHIVKTAERIRTKFHFQRKRNSSPYNILRRRMRSVSMDCVCSETSKGNDIEFERESQKDNLHETLNEIVDLTKNDNRINKISMKDITKLGKNLHIEKILKSKRTLRKSISYRNSPEMRTNFTIDQPKVSLRGSTTSTSVIESIKNLPSMGIVQKELLKLLQNFIIIMPDNAIYDVIQHYVTFQLLLILANNPNGDVRAEVVGLLANLCDRLPPDRISQYFKLNYFFHFANQISIYPANYALMMACRRLALCGPECPKQKHQIGIVLLISILPQLMTSHEYSLRSSLLLICNLYERYTEDRAFFVESGILSSLLKCTVSLYTKTSHVDFTRGIAYHILFTIYYLAKKFLTSYDQRHLQYLWNLLNYMDYIEKESNSVSVSQGIRTTQARILNGLLNACQQKFENRRILRDRVVKTAKSIIYIRKSNLTAPEMRHRFQCLMERTVMFLQKKDSKYELHSEENELVRTVIRLGLIGRMKIGSMIIWSLCPNRGVELRFFIIRCLSYLMKSKHVITFGFNISLIRTFSNHFYTVVSGMPGFVSTNQFLMLSKFVKFIGGSTSGITADIERATLRIDEISRDIQQTHALEIERTVHEFEPIALSCVETSLKVTRTYSELQNTERRNLLNQMRCEKTDNFNWKYFINQMIHEGAPFYNDRYNKVSWEMDDTEGPSRTRLRFRRCNLAIPDRFLLPEAREKYSNLAPKAPLQYLVESLEREKNSLSDQVLYNFSSAYITADSEFSGDLVVTETVIKFFPDDEKEEVIVVEIANILDIWLRRYMHHNKAVELFMVSGRSLFFVLRELNDRKIFAKYFADKICDSSNSKWHYFMLQQWRDGQLTNWEYLTALNQLSGRSYQDLMQYPVFPWILSDYQSSVLDLTNPNIYRKLEKPIAIQHPDNEEHFREMYEYLSQPGNRNVSHFPYHYSSHYSNSGTVLSFLIRVPPFTSMFIKYQDNNFDLPDRTFFSVRHAWRLASKDSQTDVKELIPEFFTLPEMFENSEDFDFGVRQSGERVHHVTLPPWSNNSSRLFVLIHRQALESDFVRSKLHLWIDLIFGCKQTGKRAVAAMNVFHSATYPEFPEPASTDPVDRSAYATMTRTYGQMPKQIIAFPHPPATIGEPTCTYQ
uniref:DUF4704 domain-containing protein n=1 Tax=Phlebotomus papatasi TaxID=29031 RepID=A0A1B0DFL6_PHLPP